ncbi:hypothetical protein [Citrobacter sp. Cf224]|uniref:hypothetical protein n=1 Tax=Citrobacter sp. Cf224 TaxID=2985087 RepID=UPI0025770A83|nr:hypothetical protein [Citrobacter sp. Cf224]MDM3068056.1 hypothetical protein [Citrobacter sp. Cf224]HDS6881062.1 hypothetical protein [Citrobacter freundii]
MNSAAKRKNRIKSLKRDELPSLWQDISNEEFTDLIVNSTSREISLLYSHMNASAINNSIKFISDDAIRHLFDSLHSNTVNKIISSCNDYSLKKLVSCFDYDLIRSTLSRCNFAQKEKLMRFVSEDDKAEYIRDSNNPPKEHTALHYYTSNAFDNVLKGAVVDRIRDLEEREVILEKNFKHKEHTLNERIKSSEYKLLSLNEQLNKKQEELKNKESEYSIKQIEIQEKIKNLEKEHAELQQARLEIKFPEYVDTAVNGLKTKGNSFEKKALWWNVQGGVALFLSILSAVASLIYGGYQFHSAAKENIDWFFFLFLLIKGLIIVTLFGAWAKYAFNVANAYVHEALKRSDRMHAISFGKFYLEIYGNKVDQKEMKDIFENWNINTDSAFTKVKEPDFSIKQVEQISKLIESVRKIKE